MAMKKLLGGLVLAAAAFLGACGGSGNSDFDKFMKLDSEKAVAFAAGGEDCAAKAKVVGEWRTKYSPEYKALQKKLNAQWSSGPPKDILEKHGDKMKANKKAVIDAMLNCSNDETFGKMMDDTGKALGED